MTADMIKTAAPHLKVTVKVTHSKKSKKKTGLNTSRGVPNKQEKRCAR